MMNHLNENQKQFAVRMFVWSSAALFLLFVGGAVFVGAKGIEELKDWKDEGKFEISVSGEGSVFLKPDVANLNLTVKTAHTALLQAQKENAEKSNQLVAFLKSKGIEEKDIKTSYYNIYPQYQYDTRPCVYNGFVPCPPASSPRISGYEVTNGFSVKVRKLDAVGEVLSGATEAGANEISGPSFTIDDDSVAQDEARALAIKDAREKAAKLAGDLNIRMGRIVGYSEGGYYPPMFYAKDSIAGAAEGRGGATAPNIQPGENEIRVTVSIVFEVRK